MNFALLGIGPLTRPFMQAIASQPEHQLSYLITEESVDPALLQFYPGVQVHPLWETLLQGAYDLVIVTGSHERDLQAARDLYAQRQPLALCPLYRMQAEFVYELSLIQDDSQTLLIPVIPGLWQRQIENLQGQIRTSAVQNLDWERSLPQTWFQNSSIDVQQSIINEWLLSDLMLLRTLGGEYDVVTAMRTEINSAPLNSGAQYEHEKQISHLTVTLSGNHLPPVCWRLKHADKVRAELRYNTAVEQHVKDIEEPLQNQEQQEKTPNIGFEQHLITPVLERMIQYVKSRSSDPDLRALTRGFETVDAVQRSIKRRRSVDLYFETTSERSQFKSQMTAIGCGVLLLTPLLLVVRLMLGTLLPEQLLLLKFTGVLVFAPLFLFLLLQLLIFLAQPTGKQ